MPTLTTTIEDISPLIIYSPDWRAGTSGDQSADQYSASNFILTSTAGGTASFSFNGTGVTIYGANRPNHGLYQVQLDGSKSPPVNGSNPGLFQTPLFTASGLTQGQHEVVFQNVDAWADVDFITWEGDVGETQGDTLYVNTFHDTHPSFSYEGAWITNPDNLGTFSGGSGHATSTSGASFTYTFSGDGVSMYGPVGPNGASYTAQVDSNDVSTLTTIKAQYTPQVLLYHATNLGVGQHQVKIAYVSSSSSASGQVFAVDYANVYTTIPPASTPRSTGNGLTAVSIVGIVLCVIAALGFLATLAFFLCQRQKRRAEMSAKGEKPSALEPQARVVPFQSHGTSDVGTLNASQLFAGSSSEASRNSGFPGSIFPQTQQAYPSVISEKAARRILPGRPFASGPSSATAGSSSSDPVITSPPRSDGSGLEPPDYDDAMDVQAR